LASYSGRTNVSVSEFVCTFRRFEIAAANRADNKCVKYKIFSKLKKEKQVATTFLKCYTENASKVQVLNNNYNYNNQMKVKSA